MQLHKPAVLRAILLLAGAVGKLAQPPLAAAQHAHEPSAPVDSTARVTVSQTPLTPEGTPVADGHAPMGSGTSWLPRSAPVRGAHIPAGRWMVMIHGIAYGYYTKQSTNRGGWHAGSINWGMIGAARPIGRGRVEFRAMASAEPYTLGGAGYPHLLQTGETYQGVPLHDRQHPHELVMELSTKVDWRLAGPLNASLYLAPVGEPAAGPVAFVHRPAGMADPFSPLAHHWQDASHITFGVITAGLFTRRLMLEASLFNGREPDEKRTNFDYSGRKLDSWSGRLTIAPATNWALSAWYAYFESHSAFYPEDWLKRVGASVLHSRRLGRQGAWSNALIWGASRHEPSNRHPVTRLAHSITAETTLEIGRRNTLFLRAEHVEKDVEDLFIPHIVEEIHDIRSISAGYVLDLVRLGGAALGLGVRGSLNSIPPRLAYYYGGDRSPTGGAVFTRLTFGRRAPQDPHAGH